jgi:hypothetical protein
MRLFEKRRPKNFWKYTSLLSTGLPFDPIPAPRHAGEGRHPRLSFNIWAGSNVSKPKPLDITKVFCFFFQKRSACLSLCHRNFRLPQQPQKIPAPNFLQRRPVISSLRQFRRQHRRL